MGSIKGDTRNLDSSSYMPTDITTLKPRDTVP